MSLAQVGVSAPLPPRRHAVRTGGGVGSLVRLLKPDCSSRMQSSACAALSLLAARDAVVQDSCRYLGAVDLLVELVATARPAVAEVARCDQPQPSASPCLCIASSAVLSSACCCC